MKYFLFFIIAFTVSNLGAATRMALLAPPERQAIADLLLSDLASYSDELELLERNELTSIRKELELNNWSYSSGLAGPQFASADIIAIISADASGGPILRLISTHTSAILGAIAVPGKADLDWSSKAAAWIAKYSRSDRITGVPLTILEFKSQVGSYQNSVVTNAISHALFFQPGITVMERRDLASATYEKTLRDQSLDQFEAGDYLLEGTFFAQTDEIRIEVILRSVGQNEPILKQAFKAKDLDTVSKQVAHAIASSLGMQAPMIQRIKPEIEAQEQLNHGLWAMQWGLYEEAEVSFSNALVLDPQNEAQISVFLAAAYTAQVRFSGRLNGSRAVSSQFCLAIEKLQNATAYIYNATRDPSEVTPEIYGISFDVLRKLALPLTSAAIADGLPVETQTALAAIRRNARAAYANLQKAEQTQAGLLPRKKEAPWIIGTRSQHLEFQNCAYLGILCSGLWQETNVDAINALRKAVIEVSSLPDDARAAIIDVTIHKRHEVGWIARWPGGLNNAEDISKWMSLAKADGDLPEIITGLAALEAYGYFKNSPYRAEDPDFLASTAKQYEQVLIQVGPEIASTPSNFNTLCQIATILHDIWTYIPATIETIAAKEQLERCHLALHQCIYTSPASFKYPLYNYFYRVDIIPNSERGKVKGLMTEKLKALSGSAHETVSRHLANLGKAPLREEGVPVKSEKVIPKEFKTVGNGQKPSAWYFLKRSAEYHHPDISHFIVAADDRIFIRWAYHDRISVEVQPIETVWFPPAAKVKNTLDTEACIIEEHLFIHVGHYLAWTPVDREAWESMDTSALGYGEIHAVGQRLLFVNRGTVAEIDWKQKQISILSSARSDGVETQSNIPVGLWFQDSQSAQERVYMDTSEQKRAFLEMIKRGELQTRFVPRVAWWAAAQLNGRKVETRFFKRDRNKEYIPGLGNLGPDSVIAAAADKDAIWLLSHVKDNGLQLSCVPLNGSIAKKYSIIAPKYSDTILLSADKIYVYSRIALPLAIFNRDELKAVGHDEE
jgi:tetratricopeptide (TPR) repeat protein